ncbi:hypothetical protein JCM3774_001506 [Rhodotorula dairenensis]
MLRARIEAELAALEELTVELFPAPTLDDDFLPPAERHQRGVQLGVRETLLTIREVMGTKVGQLYAAGPGLASMMRTDRPCTIEVGLLDDLLNLKTFVGENMNKPFQFGQTRADLII